MPLSPGDLVDGKYRVVGLIGEGGMGSVYEGENVRIGRRVAIKVMHAEVSVNPDFAKRFEREARASARIGSEHICDVLDLGDLPGGECYMVMEFLEGQSLADRVRDTRLTLGESARIAHQLLEGLGKMHAAGIVHRDLKPANIFLARAPRGGGDIVKILDFGVSKFEPQTPDTHALTNTGTVMGTPQYMSPEQARGKIRQVDARSDLYAVGVILYRCVAGVAPFEGENVQELLFKIALEEAVPLEMHNPEVDPGFAALVRKAMAREQESRFQTAREFQDAVSYWGRAQGRPSLAFEETLADGTASAVTGPQMRRSFTSPSSPSSPSGLPRSPSSPSASGTPRTPSERALAARMGKATPTAWGETSIGGPPAFPPTAPSPYFPSHGASPSSPPFVSPSPSQAPPGAPVPSPSLGLGGGVVPSPYARHGLPPSSPSFTGPAPGAVAPPPRSRAPLFLAIAIVGTIAAAGVGIVVARMDGKGAAAAVATASSRPQAASAAAAPLPAPSSQADTDVASPPPPTVDLSALAAPAAASATAPTHVHSAPTSPRTATPTAAAPMPSTTASASATSAQPAAPPTAAATARGRKIRTDF